MSISEDLDTMRDVYMLPSQQAAFDRLAAELRRVEASPVATVEELRRDCRDELHMMLSGDNLQPLAGLLFQRVRLVPLSDEGAI